MRFGERCNAPYPHVVADHPATAQPCVRRHWFKRHTTHWTAKVGMFRISYSWHDR